jgi:hypothetical protein
MEPRSWSLGAGGNKRVALSECHLPISHLPSPSPPSSERVTTVLSQLGMKKLQQPHLCLSSRRCPEAWMFSTVTALMLAARLKALCASTMQTRFYYEYIISSQSFESQLSIPSTSSRSRDVNKYALRSLPFCGGFLCRVIRSITFSWSLNNKISTKRGESIFCSCFRTRNENGHLVATCCSTQTRGVQASVPPLL